MEWRRRFNENLAGIARPLTHSLRHKNVIWAISYMPAYVKSPIPTHYNSPLPSNLRPKGNSIIVTVHAWIIERNAMSTLIPKKIQNFHHRWRCSLTCLIANCINIIPQEGNNITVPLNQGQRRLQKWVENVNIACMEKKVNKETAVFPSVFVVSYRYKTAPKIAKSFSVPPPTHFHKKSISPLVFFNVKYMNIFNWNCQALNTELECLLKLIAI